MPLLPALPCVLTLHAAVRGRYAKFKVEYANEHGKDDTGLTKDMFSNFHRSLHQQFGRFFHDHGPSVLPIPDREAERAGRLVLPFLEAPSLAGLDAAGSCSSSGGGGSSAHACAGSSSSSGGSGSSAHACATFPWERLRKGSVVLAKWGATTKQGDGEWYPPHPSSFGATWHTLLTPLPLVPRGIPSSPHFPR